MKIAELLKDEQGIAFVKSNTGKTILLYQDEEWRTGNNISHQLLYSGPSEEEAVDAFIKNEER
jgi:hypothetical protein